MIKGPAEPLLGMAHYVRMRIQRPHRGSYGLCGEPLKHPAPLTLLARPPDHYRDSTSDRPVTPALSSLVVLFLSTRLRRSRHFGWWALLNYTPNEFGLIGLYGIVVSPRAGKPWRERLNAAGERRR